MAIQFLACNGGFCVFCATVEMVKSKKKRTERTLIKNSLVIKVNVVSNKVNSVFLCIYLSVLRGFIFYYGATKQGSA